MDTVIQQFRAALFGFNRKDVQQYIEQTADAHRQELALLREQLEQTQARSAELEAALSGAQSEKSDAAAEEARVRASLEESNRALSVLRGELSQSESKLMVARKALERMKAQLDTLEPMAESYAQLKERVAIVELDAHRKAQTTVDEAQAEAERVRLDSRARVGEAQAEAERVRADTRAWVDGVLAQYGRFRQGMDALLEQMEALGQISAQMEALDETARDLREMGGPEPSNQAR